MFDKIPSLKDFIIYLIPGILICYFSLNIFNFMSPEVLSTQEISGNAVLTFVGIIFSFLIGFLFSQIQLIVYNKILRNHFRKMRTIRQSLSCNDLKETLLNRISKVFEIPVQNRANLLDDEYIVFMCLNYVKIKTNEESQQFINRSSNLSSFASVLFIPTILGILNFLFVFNFSNCLIIWIMTITSVVVFIVTIKILKNFKDDWFKTIFRQFLILSKMNT